MPLKDWLEREAGVPNTPIPAAPTATTTTLSESYANALIGAGIRDHEQDLPKIGLTLDDLRELGVAVGYRHRILAAIQKINQPTLTREASEDAKDRHDLIKRFVPIALSVGFAARLIDIGWFKNGTPITDNEWQQLVRLLAGVFVAVSGWEWYHRDLRCHPLNHALRFFVDVAVVITTIVFLYSSGSQGHWFESLILIFVLYVIWDALTIWEYAGDFKPSTSPLGYQPWRGPITDILWLVYFIVVGWLTFWPFANYNYQAFVVCLFVFLGALSLRLLARRPERMTRADLAWAVAARAGTVFGLAVAYFVVSFFHLADYVAAVVVFIESLF